jgi:hypothetical protein
VRAHDFLAQKKQGKIRRTHQDATVGLHKFRDPGGYDRTYELNRVMMAAACADGTDAPVDMDQASWIGKYNTAQPYTQVEQQMLKQAFQAVGSDTTDLNHGDLKSKEHPAVNYTSPITAFKGYPR